MSLSYVYTFPMIVTVSFNIVPLSLIMLGLVNYFVPYIILNSGDKTGWFFSGFESLGRYHLRLLDHLRVVVGWKNNQRGPESSNRKETSGGRTDDEKICSQEVEMVMGRLGVFVNPEGARLHGRLGSEDLYKLFEEKEPTLEEVKEAFDVFDENKDGFIDERELQRVLCALGLKEGSDTSSCRKMIKAFDEDGDGRIDFTEFVKFMENSFC